MSHDFGPTTLAIIDEQYDLDRASDGRSRYGVYLHQQNLGDWFWDDEIDPADFARFAWHVATGPIMSPAYVKTRPDLGPIRIVRAEDDGAPLVEVEVPLRHSALTREIRPPYRVGDWDYGPLDLDGGDYRALLIPRDETKPALLITSTLRVPAGDWITHRPSGELKGEALVDDAKAAVTLLAAAINEKVGPTVAALLGDETGRW
ncbi:hypothetical protein [Streptomyces sp. cg36]|uniref:hypothetical protein n=1 Tax=Streptomyces sp. cg36 TaxID=3238798 RepID=UPI0034E2439A